MKNNQRFFSNHECEHFPCHAEMDPERFNCLFCYCPLYFMTDECGGVFDYTNEMGIKNCMYCHLPHDPDFYDEVVAKLKEV